MLLQRAVGAPPRNYLIDAKTGSVYPWPVNHETEESLKTLGRRLTRSGPSLRVRLIRHHTHPGPARLILHGKFIDHSQSQYHAFIAFFENCDDRVFIYIDASGDAYEVVLTQFDARRKLSIMHADGSYFEYSLEMHVVNVIQGPLKGYVS